MSNYKANLIDYVISKSSSKNWESAVSEWELVRTNEDEEKNQDVYVEKKE